ncbi:hypothetical protein LSAT2_001077 [Lamellibrachia satsuma]|nr:hypothetical protein LSAT2_001077 [Lamellibrachia satsuma]
MGEREMDKLLPGQNATEGIRRNRYSEVTFSVGIVPTTWGINRSTRLPSLHICLHFPAKKANSTTAKMKSLVQSLLVLLGAATVFGSGQYCSYEDASVVMTEWNNMLKGGNSAPILLRVANAVFSAMFGKEPTTRGLFTRVHVEDMHSGEFHAHSLRVANMLDNLINHLHSPDTLDKMLAHLSDQHIVRDGVRHQYFHVMQDIIYGSLGSLLDVYHEDAWRNCLFGVFRGIAKSLPD